MSSPDIATAFADAAAAVEACVDALDHAKAHALFRAAVKGHPGGQVGWAREHGVSPTYISDVLHGRREISEHLAGLLGLERRMVFVPTEPFT